jgi:ABC-type multidrug transport system ATPase subunit
MLGLDAAADEVAVKTRAAYVGPELEYANWGKIHKAIRFVRGFYPATWDDTYCQELLELFKLNPNDKIATLSFGSRTKLALVIALSRRPELLVLDEPTTGLDAIAKRELFAALLELVEDAQHTILISSHNLSDLERFADHVAIINNGKILHAGPMDKVIEPFCIVDFTLPMNHPLAGQEGITLIQRQGSRVRVLLDRNLHGMERLDALGARDVTRADPSERGVAMVFQTYALYPHMTVAENMGFGLKMTGHPKDQIASKVKEASRILKLDDYLQTGSSPAFIVFWAGCITALMICTQVVAVMPPNRT